MTRHIAVVHEAESDFVTATDLADRVLQESVGWLRDVDIRDCRVWFSESREGRRLTWTGIKKMAKAAKVRGHGHFRRRGGDPGNPGEDDARAARRAILYLLEEFPDLDAIILIRDRDKYPDRRAGLEQARAEDHGGIPIVIGLAVVEREAWVLCGFHPVDEAEVAMITAARQRLGFDPCLRSHELTAYGEDAAKRSAKRALHELTAGDLDRERRCWLHPALPTLRGRGAENGLADYLGDVRDRLVGLFGRPA